VVVDGKNQSTKDGKLEEWSDTPEGARFSASADDVYPGVSLRRTLNLKPDGTLHDRFECASSGEHVYDWAFHAPGALTSSLTFQPRPEGAGKENGYQHMKEVAAAGTGEAFWVRWTHGSVTLTLEFRPAPGTEVIRAVAPGRDPAERVPMVLVRRKAARTAFDVTHRVR
jgi:hypothetical protein